MKLSVLLFVTFAVTVPSFTLYIGKVFFSSIVFFNEKLFFLLDRDVDEEYFYENERDSFVNESTISYQLFTK